MKKISDLRNDLLSSFNSISKLTDEQILELFDEKLYLHLFKSILDREKIYEYTSFAEFFLSNKNRSHLLANMRLFITLNYSFDKEMNGVKGYVSPFHTQFYENGILLLEGLQPFGGSLVLYDDKKELKYAIAARDIPAHTNFTKDDFNFISIDEVKKLFQNNIYKNLTDEQLNQPIDELTLLLSNKHLEEAKVQELINRFPWILGLEYNELSRHDRLDDKNIPDFTMMNIRTGGRDILEIKAPFISLFRSDGKFGSAFHEAWQQAEDYLRFATDNRDYLYKEKGLLFNNPICILLIGYKLTQKQVKMLRQKELFNPRIKIYTYNDLIRYATSIVDFIKNIKESHRD